MHCGTCWDRYFFNNGRLIVSGVAIINEWITIDNALSIEYSFN